ncbi:hypothetical protein DL96DRAFT_1701833 [Flagelloscypha sp. PMI_526]|nr:hypothetical protein DL96DRAFT_1701833 [Flagelloscypha sp. PMI_526]
MQFSPQSSSHGDFPPPVESFFDSSDQVLLYRESPSSQFLPWRPGTTLLLYVSIIRILTKHLRPQRWTSYTFSYWGRPWAHTPKICTYQLLSEPLAHESPQSPIDNGAAKIPHYISLSISYPLDIESQSLCSANDGIVRDGRDIAPSPQSITIPGIGRTESNMIKAEDVMGATRPTVWALAKTCQLANGIQTRQIYNKELVDECTGLLCKLQVEESQLASLHHKLNSEVIASHSSMIKQVFNAAAQLGVCALMDHDEILSLPTQHTVTLTMSFLRMIATTEQLLALRSLYLPLFLCGALTKESELREEITSILLANTELGDRFEDSRSILSVLEKLWWSVPLDGKPKSVPWRQALADCSAFHL